MQKKNKKEELKEAILALEQRQKEEKIVLNNQFSLVLESLKPINILRKSVNEFAASFDLKNQIIHTGTGLLAGFLTRKVVVRRSTNPLIRLSGLIVQYGVTNYVSKNSQLFGNLALNIIKNLTDRTLNK